MVAKFLRNRAAQRAMTLIELILALSLSVVIMMAIGMAINLHMKTLQTRRTNVEESQLARQVLRRVADDLRSAVQYQVIDFSSVEKMASGGVAGMAGAAMAGAGVDPAMADETGLNAALLGGLTDSAAEEEAAPSIAGTSAPPKIPGLYGNQYELQIDVSRLPRIDEYQVMLNPISGESVADVPSDVKTVAYYLQPDTLATATTSTLNDPTTSERVRATGAVGRGLVRRELDRAVSMWAAENNNLEDLTTQGEMLAMEVTGLEFRYYDGAEWLTEWNSEDRQGLPVAVAIAVEIGGDASSSADDTSGGSLLEPTIAAATASPADQAATATNRLLYRLVVHLPASEPTSADSERFPETTETEDPAAATSGSDASANSGNNNQGQAGNGQNQGGVGGQGGPGGGGPGQGGGGRGGRGGPGGNQGGGGPGGGGQGGPGGGGRGGMGGGRAGQTPGGGGGFGGGQGGGQRGGAR